MARRSKPQDDQQDEVRACPVQHRKTALSRPAQRCGKPPMNHARALAGEGAEQAGDAASREHAAQRDTRGPRPVKKRFEIGVSGKVSVAMNAVRRPCGRGASNGAKISAPAQLSGGKLGQERGLLRVPNSRTAVSEAERQPANSPIIAPAGTPTTVPADCGVRRRCRRRRASGTNLRPSLRQVEPTDTAEKEPDQAT